MRYVIWTFYKSKKKKKQYVKTNNPSPPKKNQPRSLQLWTELDIEFDIETLSLPKITIVKVNNATARVQTKKVTTVPNGKFL